MILLSRNTRKKPINAPVVVADPINVYVPILRLLLLPLILQVVDLFSLELHYSRFREHANR